MVTLKYESPDCQKAPGTNIFYRIVSPNRAGIRSLWMTLCQVARLGILFDRYKGNLKPKH